MLKTRGGDQAPEPSRDPSSPAEWQEAVDWAETLLQLDSARLYGLVTGGPDVNVARCIDIVERGAAQGVRATATGIDACLAALLRSGGSR